MRYATVLMLLLLAGCYTYVPVGEILPEKGNAVRTHLSLPGQFRLGDISANNVTRVDGEVVRWTPEQLVLSAFWMKSASGYEHQGTGATVVIPRDRIESVEEKRFSWLRTGAVIGAGFLLGAVLDFALDRGSQGSDGIGGPNGQPQ